MRQQDYILVALETENVTMGAWGSLYISLYFWTCLMFPVIKTKKKKIVMAAYGQKTQVQIAQSQLFKGLYGSQNYSNLFLVTLS